MSDFHGRYLWYELLTTDPEAAKAFYSETIGWGMQSFDMGEEPYSMFAIKDRSVAGVMQLPDKAKKMGAPPHWLGYSGTPDVDATLAQAVKLGAKVYVEPMGIPEVGRIAVLADPLGAVFALFAPAKAPENPDKESQVGDFSWNELATTDWKAAWSFYSTLFKWQKADDMDMGEMGTYRMFNAGAHMLGGMFTKSADMPGPAAWIYYARVPDTTEAVARVKRLGGQVLNGPMEVPGGDLVAQCMDPQGAVFAVHSAKK